jgi:dimethylaniline monooxygenase (N-oxide forming)
MASEGIAPMTSEGKVAIIGAGSSGIAACQALRECGLPFDCFERGSDIGGLWRYENDNEFSSAYASLHTNTSRKTTQYASYPMPEGYPNFPHHTQMLAYLEGYVAHFALREHIRFCTEVTDIRRVDDAWEVKWRDADGVSHSDRYTAVLVASGHHWDPNHLDPPLPGSFSGQEIHSHYYRTSQGFEGKNVLVVGLGNSAIDIACDTSQVAKMTFLTARRGAWIVPKYLGGEPLSDVSFRFQSRIPTAREVEGGPLFKLILSLTSRRLSSFLGQPEDYGLPRPDHKFGAGVPTGPAEKIYAHIGNGRVTPKPWISRLEEEQVIFQDGSTEQIDIIVYSTGYKITLPFLSESIVDHRDGTVPLYKRVVHPDQPGLYFIGLVDVPGPLPPLAELQAEWVAELIDGKGGLPSRTEMMQAIAREDRRRQKRFGASGRHPLFVDPVPYLHALQRERSRARRRRGPSRPGQPAPSVPADVPPAPSVSADAPAPAMSAVAQPAPEARPAQSVPADAQPAA